MKKATKKKVVKKVKIKQITNKIASLKLPLETEGPFAGIPVTVYGSKEFLKKNKTRLLKKKI